MTSRQGCGAQGLRVVASRDLPWSYCLLFLPLTLLTGVSVGGQNEAQQDALQKPPSAGQSSERVSVGSGSLQDRWQEISSALVGTRTLSDGGSAVSSDAGAASTSEINGTTQSADPPINLEPGCAALPEMVRLRNSIQRMSDMKLTEGDEDPMQICALVYDRYEDDPGIFNQCAGGVVTALVYLSIAQETDLKYELLRKATYLLFASESLDLGSWPVRDELVRTLYANTEGQKPPLVVPKKLRAPIGVDTTEAVERNLKYENSLTVHFDSVMFYYFYEPEEENPCVCRSGSWCLPYWVRALTNATVDVWVAGRDVNRTVYRMDARGCLVSLRQGLANFSLLQAKAFDLLFVFEVNSFMHPEARGGIFAKKTILYPTYNLSPGQVRNFEAQKISVLRDDQVLKPPNPRYREILENMLAAPGSVLEVQEETEEALARAYGVTDVSTLPYPNQTRTEWQKVAPEELNASETVSQAATEGLAGVPVPATGSPQGGWKNSSSSSVAQKKEKGLIRMDEFREKADGTREQKVVRILPEANMTASRLPPRFLHFPPDKSALIYPALLKPAKGQLDFLNMLYHRDGARESAETEQILRGVHVYFIGACGGNVTYCSQTAVRCAQLRGRLSGFQCTFLNSLTEREMALVYRNAAGTLLYSSNDCNARILHESVLMNKPFFATAEAQVPASMQHLGHIVDFGAEDVSEEFALFVNALRKNMWGDRPRKFAQQHLSDEAAYGKMLLYMEKQWWG
ncbi:unnamed protein product [Amoebophrya sp. A25]|nr:unnamed protein product [Amoebophrya sp. A25]|eukprot:GSA25T00023521001.1